MSYLRRTSLYLLLALGLWTLLALFAVPWGMSKVYQSGEPAFLDTLFNRADPENTLEYYLQKWRQITWAGYAGLTGFICFIPVLRTRWFFERCVGPATAETLGGIRIFVCGALLFYTLCYNIVSTSELSWDFTFPMGLMTLLETLPIGFKAAIKNYWFLGGLHIVTAVSLAMAMIGLWTRWSLPIATAGIVLVAGVVRQHTHLAHPYLIPLWLIFLLNFTPCTDGWSVDRLLRNIRGESLPDSSQPAEAYGWVRYLCWTLIALSYTISGLHKLITGGFYWWEPLNLKVHVFASQMTTRGDWMFFGTKPGLWIAQHLPDAAFAVMAIAALTIETGYVSVLFSKWARRIIPLAASCMHFGIFVLQKFLFLDMMLMPLVFLNYTWARRWIGAKRAKTHPPSVVHYQAGDAKQEALVRVLKSWDLFDRLIWQASERESNPVSQANQNLLLGPIQRIERAGESLQGEDAVSALAGSLPLLWPLSLSMKIPGVRKVAFWKWNWLVRFVDSRSKSTDQLKVQHAEPTEVSLGKLKPIFWFVSLGMVVSLLLAGAGKMEKYPLTAWNLFSDKNHEPVASTWVLMQQTRNGESSVARPEDLIGFYKYEEYQDIVLTSIAPRRQGDFFKFLEMIATHYNRDRPPEEQIVSFELQFRWNFGKYPLEPEKAELKTEIHYDLETKKSAVIRHEVKS